MCPSAALKQARLSCTSAHMAALHLGSQMLGPSLAVLSLCRWVQMCTAHVNNVGCLPHHFQAWARHRSPAAAQWHCSACACSAARPPPGALPAAAPASGPSSRTSGRPDAGRAARCLAAAAAAAPLHLLALRQGCIQMSLQYFWCDRRPGYCASIVCFCSHVHWMRSSPVCGPEPCQLSALRRRCCRGGPCAAC